VIRSLAAVALVAASFPALAATTTKAGPTAKAEPTTRAEPATKAETALSSTAPWWEKVTVTIAGDGKSNSCKYESSLTPDASKACDVAGDAKSLGAGGPTAKNEFTRLTFERRFNPGAMPVDAALQTGDTLLGRQVMSLAIDGAGKVKGCRVVATSGDVTPAYGCDDAQSEHFEASAVRSGTEAKVGYMTVLVYGHEEHLV
jgi:hypothetical protein